MTEHDILKGQAMVALDKLKRCIANGDAADAKASIKALIKKHTK